VHSAQRAEKRTGSSARCALPAALSSKAALLQPRIGNAAPQNVKES
jgi:hypothetical protein